MNPRIAMGVLGGLVLALGVGWCAGNSGRSEAELARRDAVERVETALARAQILDGRVSLFQNNFGEATKRFNDARAIVERMQTQLREQGQSERAGRLEVVLGHLREAQRLALALDHGAHNQAEEALKALGS